MDAEGCFFQSGQRRASMMAILDAWLLDERQAVLRLLSEARLVRQQDGVGHQAALLVDGVRISQPGGHLLQALLQEYNLSSQEGVLLMCIAEAFLRIPDAETVDLLIRDKLPAGEWHKHLRHSDSWLVNAASWGLMFTGEIIRFDPTSTRLTDTIKQLVAENSEVIIRAALQRAIELMGSQFVMGADIHTAYRRSRLPQHVANDYSFDMLGEAALSKADAEYYFSAYHSAIAYLGQQQANNSLFDKPSISIKLSALHPRYQVSQSARVMTELRARLFDLVCFAKQQNVSVTIDAEESERLVLSLDLFASVFCDPALADWDGFGLAVQAYQKRAYAVMNWLIELAQGQGKRIPVRLIKGAYWDSEIKRAQEQGLSGYPVFTRKQYTDLSYQVCAALMMNHLDVIYPQFATHNAYTMAFILQHIPAGADYEFQRLHGMGDGLYQVARVHYGCERVKCRVYAPVGGHKELLPYLVRRLLENGANSSFVHQIQDEAIPVAKLVRDPVVLSRQHQGESHPAIVLPRQLYLPERLNSRGANLADERRLTRFSEHLKGVAQQEWFAYPQVAGESYTTEARVIYAPYARSQKVGLVFEANESLVDSAIACAEQAYKSWYQTPVSQRCKILHQMAGMLEQHFYDCAALLMLEAGKSYSDVVAEVREAIDFCRYYAVLAEQVLGKELVLPGPTGEQNVLKLAGRGPFVCISPWNFPLAVFTGQIAAALVTGNPVIAKPAEQTPLIAAFAVGLFYQAGVPKDVLQLLPGTGPEVGQPLVCDERIKGVVFTGSHATARLINRCLAQREGDIVPLVAETGGMNAMIVDSTALLEQVVGDVVTSAFNSAGQRCSALRVLFVQQDVADRLLELLSGAMAELNIDNPCFYASDVGPVIDEEAQATLLTHIAKMKSQARLVYQCELDAHHRGGYFVPPTCFEIDHIEQLEQEVFGPVLHVVRYRANELAHVVEQINQSGYGLTLGIHSRIEATIRYLKQQLHIGNIYVNRNMVGAVVGVQPFGGEGLSGTGPKAGGPHYLYRFCCEHVSSTNTVAVGGNASLLVLDDD